MMRKFSLVILSGVFAISLGGCNFFGGQEEESVVAPTPVPIPGKQADEAESEETAVEPPPTAVSVVSPDLIRSTNANQRVQQINQGQRQDPFANLVITPPPPPQPAPTARSQSPAPAPAPQARVPQAPQGLPSLPSGPRQTPQSPGTQSPPGAGSRPAPTSPLSPGGIAALPPIPQPDLAAAVVVTGVVQIGDTIHAIVNAPNEAASRYVRVGQRISNGQVLVKRIEMGGGSDPIVILEQNGVEVARRVGEGVPDETTAQQTASTTPSPVFL